LWVGGLEARERLDAVELGHPDVHDHQVGARFLDLVDDLDPGGRLEHREALVSEELLQQRSDRRIVVGNENALLGHCFCTVPSQEGGESGLSVLPSSSALLLLSRTAYKLSS